MTKYVLYELTCEAKDVKKYYPGCTFDAREKRGRVDPEVEEEFDNLENALKQLNRHDGMYFPYINRGCYVEYFVAEEVYDDDDEFIEAIYYYWNYNGKEDGPFAWFERRNHIDVYDWDAVVNMMDDEIREELSRQYWRSNQDFLEAYLEKHEEKFDEEFEMP